MDAVEFGDGAEPWSVGRGGVKLWLHCRVDDVASLPQAQQDELRSWLDTRATTQPVERLLISRDDNGRYVMHVAGGWVDVELTDLPDWLQRSEPQPKPARATKARK